MSKIYSKYQYDEYGNWAELDSFGQNWNTWNLKTLPLPNTEWYFAFGSNMSRKRMQKRGLIWEHIIKGSLDNYVLKFNKKSFSLGLGYANIQEQKGSTVHGILYKLESTEEALILDEYECAPDHYERVELKVKTSTGKIVKAFTYIANSKMIEKGLNPSEDYLNYLLDGKKFLPIKYYHYLKQFKTGSDKKEPLHVFVYGTLKSGFGNHNHYCKDAVSVEKATVDGELFCTGLPYVHIDKSNIYYRGSNSIMNDYLKQSELEDRIEQGESFTGIYQDAVHGELVTFDNWDSLKELDRLEGFTGANNWNHYNRILTTCFLKDGLEVACWVYCVNKNEMNFTDSDYVESGNYSQKVWNIPQIESDDYYMTEQEELEDDIRSRYPELYSEELEEQEQEQQDLYDLVTNAKF